MADLLPRRTSSWNCRIWTRKDLPERAEEFTDFLLLTGQSHVDVATKCSLLKRSCKKKIFVKTGEADFQNLFNMCRGAPKTGENLPGL